MTDGLRQFSLSQIQSDESACREYLRLIPTGVSFELAISAAFTLCPELEEFCRINQQKFNGLGSRDKGNMGKMVEFFIFGQLPDTDPNPDLSWGADIKATHFKTIWGNGMAAKERLTITNVGNTDDYSTFDPLMDTDSLQSSKYYPKLRRGVLFVFEFTSGIYNTIEDNMQKTLLCFFAYDLDEMPTGITSQLDADFEDIQDRVATRRVSQRGQIYLHIHPHGSKGDKTRALGFKNKFVTKLVSIMTGYPITVKGNSWFIKKRYFEDDG